ncbi:F0F1 ATP synthase subunit B [Lichenihabitans sp. Uapishka_5]|uniref:F0F1 ATP synthase subunit B n=1 Tax=Lichenihabitans sp. Uapishka_5 TaxID=3037302 RepID=UPI0029E7CCCC|nr:F0F1 ATP synthase subunit B [Lichenihabitans sp. Uapishka_5]MDX7949984.1 F0F1 ATP synthase subunit B [Lichenihabitans sp. Uapishka_5]
MATPEQAAEAAVVKTEIAGDATHQAGVFPPFDSHAFLPQIIWLVLIFGALYWLMSRVALPRVEGILEARKHRLAKDLGEAAAMQAQAKAAGETYDKTLADARVRSQTLAQEQHDKLHATSEAKRHAVEADLNAKLATAEAQIQETRTRAMSNVATIAEDAAAAIVDHLTGRAPDRQQVSAAVAKAS